MSLFQAIIIAIIEGITEFLPISSTAHMKFANPLIGVQPSAFTDLFEIVIQLAAILSVVVLYYKQFFDFKKIGFYFKLIIALIPAIIAGVLLKKHIDAHAGKYCFHCGCHDRRWNYFIIYRQAVYQTQDSFPGCT